MLGAAPLFGVGKLKAVKLVHFWKQHSPKTVTLSGQWKLLSETQESKA